MLAAVLGETNCPRQRLCSIRSILCSQSTCFHFNANTSPNLVPVRATQSKNAWRPAGAALRIFRTCVGDQIGFSCLSTVGLCLFRIGDRSIRSLSTATDKIPCKTISKLRTVFGESPLSNLVCENLSMCNGITPQCEDRQIQARCAAPVRIVTCSRRRLHTLALQVRFPPNIYESLSDSSPSLEALAKMPRGFVPPRRHGQPSFQHPVQRLGSLIPLPIRRSHP